MRDIVKYEKEYCSTNFEQKFMVRYRRQKILEILRNYKHDRILEIGCGMNSMAEFLSDYQEFMIVEPGEKFLANVKENLKNKDGITYIQGFMEEEIDTLQGGSYDFIIVSGLLNEIENPTHFLKLVNSLCGKNTIIYISVPNECSMHRIIAYECGLIDNLSKPSERNILLQQSRVFNLKLLEELIVDVGGGKIEILETGSYFIKPFTHDQMDQCIESGIISEQVLDGLYNLSKYIPDYGAEIYCNYKVLNGEKK